jgi:hypothetical protein
MAIIDQNSDPGQGDHGIIPGAHSRRQVFASVLLGTTGDANVAPGSASTGTDHAATLNHALSGGNVELVVDGQYDRLAIHLPARYTSDLVYLEEAH